MRRTRHVVTGMAIGAFVCSGALGVVIAAPQTAGAAAVPEAMQVDPAAEVGWCAHVTWCTTGATHMYTHTKTHDPTGGG